MTLLGEISKNPAEYLHNEGYDLNVRCASFIGVSLINFLALIIISGIGISGTLSPTVVGGVAIALTSANIFLSVLSGRLNKKDLKKRKIEFLMHAVELIGIVTISVLAFKGMLSASQIGWGVIGLSLGTLTITYIITSQVKKRESLRNP